MSFGLSSWISYINWLIDECLYDSSIFPSVSIEGINLLDENTYNSNRKTSLEFVVSLYIPVGHMQLIYYLTFIINEVKLWSDGSQLVISVDSCTVCFTRNDV